MADRTTSKQYESVGRNRVPFDIANGITLPVGTLVQVESGFANHYDGTGRLLGLVKGGENPDANGNPVGDTSQTPNPRVYVSLEGEVVKNIPIAGATALDEYVYCDDSDLDNATVTQPTTDHPIGKIVGFRSASDCDLMLFSYAEHVLGADAAASPGPEWV